MKKLFTTISFSLLVSCIYSQQLRQISFAGGSALSSISFLTDQDVLIRVSEDGKLLEWGIEWKAIQGNYYAPKLQPFPGRVDHYGAEADSSSMGKVKSIGTCMLTYYGLYEPEEKKGKLKSIGSLLLDYYGPYDNAALKGKLRFVGNQALEYYSSTENEAFRGKLKAIGNTVITYYSTFDDKLIRGKVKSIGSISYNWYTSLDRIEVRGALKSGLYRQKVNGVTYILY